MAVGKKAETIASADFPLFLVRAVGSHHFLIAGGGGASRTGIPNAFEIFEVKQENGRTVAEKVFHYNTEGRAIMNGLVMPEDKMYTLLAGIDDSIQSYKLLHKVVMPKKDCQGVRKRKGSPNHSVSDENTNSVKTLSFEAIEGTRTKTDFHKDGGYQKVVAVTPDHSLIITGGSDGCIRAWKYPDWKKLYEVEAHSNEIDGLDVNPAGNKIVSVAKDNKGCIWNTRDGSKVCDLICSAAGDTKYRYRNCKFGTISDQKDEHRLFTTTVPSVRSTKQQKSFIVKWNTKSFKPEQQAATGKEELSALAISDDGIYLGLGTISGSVSVFIAFSLQQLYHIPEAHNIFVTGLDFMPNDSSSRCAVGDYDTTLLSISADNQVKIHQVAPRSLYSPLWAIAGFLILIYLFFWFIASIGI